MLFDTRFVNRKKRKKKKKLKLISYSLSEFFSGLDAQKKNRKRMRELWLPNWNKRSKISFKKNISNTYIHTVAAVKGPWLYAVLLLSFVSITRMAIVMMMMMMMVYSLYVCIILGCID